MRMFHGYQVETHLDIEDAINVNSDIVFSDLAECSQAKSTPLNYACTTHCRSATPLNDIRTPLSKLEVDTVASTRVLVRTHMLNVSGKKTSGYTWHVSG